MLYPLLLIVSSFAAYFIFEELSRAFLPVAPMRHAFHRHLDKYHRRSQIFPTASPDETWKIYLFIAKALFNAAQS